MRDVNIFLTWDCVFPTSLVLTSLPLPVWTSTSPSTPVLPNLPRHVRDLAKMPCEDLRMRRILHAKINALDGNVSKVQLRASEDPAHRQRVICSILARENDCV